MTRGSILVAALALLCFSSGSSQSVSKMPELTLESIRSFTNSTDSLQTRFLAFVPETCTLDFHELSKRNRHIHIAVSHSEDAAGDLGFAFPSFNLLRGSSAIQPPAALGNVWGRPGVSIDASIDSIDLWLMHKWAPQVVWANLVNERALFGTSGRSTNVILFSETKPSAAEIDLFNVVARDWTDEGILDSSMPRFIVASKAHVEESEAAVQASDHDFSHLSHGASSDFWSALCKYYLKIGEAEESLSKIVIVHMPRDSPQLRDTFDGAIDSTSAVSDWVSRTLSKLGVMNKAQRLQVLGHGTQQEF